MSCDAVPATRPVTVLCERYDEVRGAWAEAADREAHRREGAALWDEILVTRAAGRDEVQLKLALIIELLEADLPPDHPALAMAQSVVEDLL